MLPNQLKDKSVKKSNLYGIIGSAVFCVILFLLLWFIVLPGMKAPEDEGIIVSFGETYNGGGRTQTPTPVAPEVKSVPRPAVVKSQKQELMTQQDNSLAIAEQKEKDRKKKEEALLEQQRKEQLRREQAALEQQRLEAERKIAERKRKEQEAIDRANMDGMFGNTSSNTGSGSSSGDTQQGNPVGKGSSGGNSWSLTGRNLSGRLVAPNYNKDVEGKITVSIRVDESGTVISATIGSPTTIGDAETRNAALTAAKSTRFSSAKDVSTGSITYNFKLR